MPQAKDPSLGINSWLEDELYHQYQFDRKSVDESWTHLFGDAGQNGALLNSEAPAARQQSSDVTATALAEPPLAETPFGPNVPRQEPPTTIPPEREPPTQVPPEREPPNPMPPEREPAPSEPPRVEPPQPSPVPQEIVPASTSTAPSQSGTKTVATASGAPLGANDQLVPLRGVAARIAENMAASLSIPVATSQRQIPVRVIEENRNIINKRRALQGRRKLSFTHLIAWAIVKSLKSNPALNHAFAENGGEPVPRRSQLR